MKIRDEYAKLNNDHSEQEFSGIEIIADNGETLYSLKLDDDGVLEIIGGNFCKHNGILLKESICVFPYDNHRIFIQRLPYTRKV